MVVGYLSQVVHPKSDIQRRSLNEAVSKSFLFNSLDKEQFQEVLDAMFERKVSSCNAKMLSHREVQVQVTNL